MKSYDKMAADVFSRRAEYEKEQRKRKTTAKRAALSVCCCSLVAVMSVGIWRLNEDRKTQHGGGIYSSDSQQNATKSEETYLSKTTQDSYQGALPSEPDTTQGKSDIEKTTAKIVDDEPDEDGKRFCYLNKITGVAAAHPLFRDPEKHYTEQWTDEETAEYFGIDLTALSSMMPEGLAYYAGDGQQDMVFENNGILVDDISEFAFKSDDGRAVYITLSRLGAVSDLLYVSDTNEPTFFGTKSNGRVEARMFEGKNISDCETLYVADFELNGVTCRLKAENLAVWDFQFLFGDIIGIY